ncbi:hypothetical protein BML2526_36080 [Providencia rettgeri]|uniref:hypothetical protein n=1 Tax=Providencia rettgeri TaxID=587 RepID=UPI0013744240|nr:hypothetical protein BML2526_36080 [Providencia rettgeri]BBV13046.1 hypothetical protein BML2576_25050 [Providencia rettgeri]BDH19150.1 hypothetical protein PrNR1418_24410 [Providencia rettgeri]
MSYICWGDECYNDSRLGITKIYGHYSREKATNLERELDLLRRVIETLNDLK